MEGLSQGLKSIAKDYSPASKSSTGFTVSRDFSTDQPHIVVRRTSSHMVSGWTCTKLCGVAFVVGVFVGFTLRNRVRRWASRLLKRL
ncbi:hypothetical protein MKW98_011536 [Papaver atlanticum]|uniref:Transmembrane protein n=1 Tax=Papaver atlanticum TaxID=357466 RepID=A0AAD4X9D7_9MAGN|nr:hypothetical protein MKW98_011536 [Papaver atlanticum]